MQEVTAQEAAVLQAQADSVEGGPATADTSPPPSEERGSAQEPKVPATELLELQLLVQRGAMAQREVELAQEKAGRAEDACKAFYRLLGERHGFDPHSTVIADDGAVVPRDEYVRQRLEQQMKGAMAAQPGGIG